MVDRMVMPKMFCTSSNVMLLILLPTGVMSASQAQGKICLMHRVFVFYPTFLQPREYPFENYSFEFYNL